MAASSRKAIYAALIGNGLIAATKFAATAFSGSEAGAFLVAYREFSRQRGDLGMIEAVRQGKDPNMCVVLFEEGAAMLGLVVAFIGIALADAIGNPLFDGIASLVIGLILGLTAAWLACETQSLLIGESATAGINGRIRSLLEASPDIVSVNEVATLHRGPAFILADARR